MFKESMTFHIFLEGTTFHIYSDCCNDEIPLASEILKQCKWEINSFNGPYLAGKALEPKRGIVELPATVDGHIIEPKLDDWSDDDSTRVIGDISCQLPKKFDFILVEANDFKGAEVLTSQIGGYHPANPGEFIQLLWYFQKHCESVGFFGWIFCYKDRIPNYAILAECHYRGDFRIIFDTQLGDIEHVNANMPTFCFFVKEMAN